MRIFLTGATGFIGSHIVTDLIAAGHAVLGMTRSDSGAAWLESVGAEIHRGDLEHPETLTTGAAQVDAVIHTAFDHDFTNFVANCEKDSRAITALGAGLEGSNRPLLVTSGTALGDAGHGAMASEDVLNLDHTLPRVASERAAQNLLDRGLNVQVMRLPQVHDTAKQGLISPYIEISRSLGAALYVGDGLNRWSAAHVTDVATLYRLAVEQGQAGERFHAVAEEGVPSGDVAKVVAARLDIPARSVSLEEAREQLGWLGMFAGLDLAASSGWTQRRLGWKPAGPGLIDDLQAMNYGAVTAEV